MSFIPWTCFYTQKTKCTIPAAKPVRATTISIYIDFDLSRSVLTTACPTSSDTSGLTGSQNRGVAYWCLERNRRRWLNQCVFWLDRACCYQSALLAVPFFGAGLGSWRKYHAHIMCISADCLPACCLPTVASTVAACHICHFCSPCDTKTPRLLWNIWIGKETEQLFRSLARVFVSSEHEAALFNTGHQIPTG